MANDKNFDVYTNQNQNITNEENLTKFNGYNSKPYFEPFTNGRSFIFMTKPFLFLNPIKPDRNDSPDFLAYNNMCKDPYLSMFLINESLNNSDRLIIKEMSYLDFQEIKSYFLPALTNKAKSFDAVDKTLETSQAFQTKQQYYIPMPTFSTISESAGTFSLSVTESYNLDFIKMMNIWVTYIDKISNGELIANPEMVKNGVIDYMSSLYYFVTEPDGRTLKYWAKFTGCYPTSVPFNALSSNRGDVSIADINIPFVYTVKEDMNPAILEDFNRVSLRITDFSIEDSNITNEANIYNASEGLDYYSFTSSSILSKEKLSQGYKNLLNSDDRDPIVYFENNQKNNDTKSNKFILSFSNKTLKDLFFINKLDEEDSFIYNYESAQTKF